MADISKITLPSGNTYDIKDATARSMIAGGITFKIVWTATDYASSSAPSSATLADIPGGYTVYYNNGASSATGTLIAGESTKGTFYLIYSKTQAGNLDTYEEVATVEDDTTTPHTYFWEKLGDTQIDLSNVVTDVTLNKSTVTTNTDTVIGSDATFTITQPTIALATAPSSDTGRVQVLIGGSNSVTDPTVTTTLSAETSTATGRQEYIQKLTKQKISASGGGASWNSKDSKTVLTGVKLTSSATTSTGAVTYVESVTGGSTSPDKAYISATASGTAVSASGDNVTALTGLGTPTTENVAKTLSTSKLTTTSITGVQSTTTSVTGVQSSTTTASKATAATSQTTLGGLTAATTSNYDYEEDILYGAYVTNETLIMGAYKKPTEQTTTQFTFADVTVPIKATSATTVPIKATSATTVATGAVAAGSTGATVATGISATAAAITSITPTTDTVLGTSSAFSVTQPTITIASGVTGDVEVVTDVSDITVTPTTKYLTVGSNGTASVIGASSTFTNTQPTLSVGSTGDVDVVTGGTTRFLAVTSSASGTGATFTPTTTYIKATASGANTAWNNKDTVTAVTGITSGTKVLTDGTSLTVTKGNA